MTDNELVKSAEKWADAIIQSSEPIRNYILKSEYDDTSRWGEIAKNYFQLLSRRAGGLWLDGPEGYGKHTAANIAVQFLHSEYMIPSVFITGSDLQFDLAPARTADVFLKYLLDMFMEENGVCLVFDCMEQCSCIETVLDRLGRLVCSYPDDSENESSAIIILIDNGNVKIPAMLRRHIMHCTFTLPTKAMRFQYINNRWDTINENAEDAFFKVNLALPASTIAELTEGCNFQQLVDAVEYIYYRDTATRYQIELDEIPEKDISTVSRREEAEYLNNALTWLMLKNGTLTVDENDIHSSRKLELMDDQHNLAEGVLSVLELIPEFLTETLPDIISSAIESKPIAARVTEMKIQNDESNISDVMTQPNPAKCREEADKMTGEQLFANIDCLKGIYQQASKITAEYSAKLQVEVINQQ